MREIGNGRREPLTVRELLIASHIKPWRESDNEERLDGMNGLLLATHADRLFDRYLMSFREVRGDFVCTLHARVRADAKKLGVFEGMRLATGQLSLCDEPRFRKYMAGHFSRHLELLAQHKTTGHT
ncbi:HNH endonuclease [Paraburkholderia sp.]|uniref:HNH endonuclease n=1 Tax=Paraburkholderia sp. TaxID=1926495 RepID=UPI003D6FC752